MTNGSNIPPAAPQAAEAPQPQSKPGTFALPFDPLRLVAAILRRWHWILISGLVPGLAGGVAGYFKVKPVFTASAQLMRQESTDTFRASQQGDPFKPRQLTVPTLVSLMKSMVLLQRVSELTLPRLSPRAILDGLTITPERNTDLITIAFKSQRSGETALRVLNVYGPEVVRMTRDMQAQEAIDVNKLLKKQLAKAGEDLRGVNQELLDFARESGLVSVDKEIDAQLHKLGELDLRYETMRLEYDTLDLKITTLEKELSEHNPLAERARAARELLAELRTKYTDANPLVDDQKLRVEEIEKEMAQTAGRQTGPPRQGEGGLATTFYQELLSFRMQKEVLAAQLAKLKTVRAAADEKLRVLPEKGLQYARIKARQQSLETAQELLSSRQREAQLHEENPIPYYRFFEAKPDQIEATTRGKKVLIFAAAGGGLGAFLCLVLAALLESLDDRLLTAADARRATRLPLLARLGDLAAREAAPPADWAFRTWLALQGRLADGPERRIVCGLAAVREGQGCSTWLELLGRAAAQREGSVLLVSNRAPLHGATLEFGSALEAPAKVQPAPGEPLWLVIPAGWRWGAVHRTQWQAALEDWRRLPGLVILVELVATDQPDTLLMAESLPQLIWLVGSGLARSRETAQRLETLRHAGCHLAGVVLNRHRSLFPWLPFDL